MKKLPQIQSVFAVAVTLAAGLALTTESTALVPGPSKTYTANADFDTGLLFNLNHNVTFDQLQLNQQISTFPLLWVANAGEDTVSKIDTNTGKEVGRYRTWSNVGYHDAWTGPAPSRTAVDAAGNCYVVNRHFDGNPAMVIKILATGFVDRRGVNPTDPPDGVMQSSSDTNANNVIDPGNPAELMPFYGINDPRNDERIAWMTQVGPAGGTGRSLSIAPDGSIWVGLYSSQCYYKLDPNTGAIVGGPYSVSPNRPYGSVVDSSGILWGAGWDSGYMVKFNTNAPLSPYQTWYVGWNYGIGYGAGKVYLGYYNPVHVYDTVTNTFSDISLGFGTYAVSVAPNGDLLVHGSGYGWGAGATRFRPDGSVVWSKPNQGGANDGTGRGCVPDSNDDVWTINLDTANVQKYAGATGNPLGVYPVGYRPYTYSDATGSTFVQTIGLGKWTAVLDTNATTTTNAKITWNANIPAGAILTVKTAASNVKATPGAYIPADFVQTMTNGGTSAQTGRYQAVEVTFVAAPGTSASPVLLDLNIKTPDVCPPLDLNKDGKVDTADQAILLAAIRARSSDPYYDVNCDGKVDIADSRYLALHYTP